MLGASLAGGLVAGELESSLQTEAFGMHARNGARLSPCRTV
jgi:hypothetical protein